MINPVQKFIEQAIAVDDDFKPLIFTNMILSLQFLKADYIKVVELAKDNKLALMPAVRFLIQENKLQLAHLNALTLMNQFSLFKNQNDDDILFFATLKCSFLKEKQKRQHHLAALNFLANVKDENKRLQAAHEIIVKITKMDLEKNAYHSQNKLYNIWTKLGGDESQVRHYLPHAFDKSEPFEIVPYEVKKLYINCNKSAIEMSLSPEKYIMILNVLVHKINKDMMMHKIDKDKCEASIYFVNQEAAEEFKAKIDFYVEKSLHKGGAHINSYEIEKMIDDFDQKFEEVYRLEKILPVNESKGKSVKL